MKVEEPNWFMRWEEELPSPDELMPLSQTLITPDLALALDLFPFRNGNSSHHHNCLTHHDSSEMAGGGGNSGGGGGEEQGRAQKRPRLVWTPQLHKRFVDAVSHLGIRHAVPKTIMQLMNVDGLTRENVASHLQKYRLYIKKVQGISSSAHGTVSHSDEQLFANGPVPHHFLTQRPPVVGGGRRPEPLLPIVSLQQHHQQMAAAQHYRQQQFHHHRPRVRFGSPPNHDHGGFLGPQPPQQQSGLQMMVGPTVLATSALVEDSDSGGGFLGPQPPQQQSGLQMMVGPTVLATSALVEDSDSGGGRRVLTLFPTNDC